MTKAMFSRIKRAWLVLLGIDNKMSKDEFYRRELVISERNPHISMHAGILRDRVSHNARKAETLTIEEGNLSSLDELIALLNDTNQAVAKLQEYVTLKEEDLYLLKSLRIERNERNHGQSVEWYYG